MAETTLELILRLSFRPHELDRDPKNRYKMLCPVCNYQSRSGGNTTFSISEDQNRWYCFACGNGGGPQEMLKHLTGDQPISYQPPPISASSSPSTGKPTRLEGATLALLCHAKGLDEQWCRDVLGWRDGRWYNTPAVEIPYFLEDNEPGPIRYRVGIDSKDRFRTKGRQTLYGLWNLDAIRKAGWCILTEGETDFATVHYHGYPVLSVPGASLWNSSHAKMLNGVRIYLWQEPDTGGDTLLKRVSETAPVWVVNPPKGIKDPNELYLQSGDQFNSLFSLLIDCAEPPKTLSAAADGLSHLPSTQLSRDGWSKGADAPLSFEEMQTMVGSEHRTEAYFKQAPTKSVRDTVREPDVSNRIPDKSALWNRACELFTVQNTSRGWGKQMILLNDSGATLSVFLLSSTWRNPVNAQYKRRAAYLNLMKLWGKEDLYQLDVAPDDWTSQRRDALSRAVRRRQGKYLYLDNQLSAGAQRFITNLPLKGAVPVTDHEELIIKGLNGIRPPARGADEHRFRPIGGCPEWFNGLYDCGSEDQDHWQVVATTTRNTDALDLQVIAAAEGLAAEWVRPYWRLQVEPGLLIHTEAWPANDVVGMLLANGYLPTKLGWRILAAAGVLAH